MEVTVEFGGGAELLVGGEKRHRLALGEREGGWRVRELLGEVLGRLVVERGELLVEKGTVRPGILLLVNDVDWELCGELDCPLSHGDTIAFISTLHGG